MLFPAVTAAIVVLLGVNTGLHLRDGRVSEGLDALAWFVLLLLFLLETRRPPVAAGRPAVTLAFRLLRLAAAGAILVAAVSFLRESEWLDAVNAWLWIGVVLLIETEIRAPQWIGRHRRGTIAAAVLLHASLAVVAAIWLAQGAWFDAWDAALWIAAFAALELDLLKRQLPAQLRAGKNT
jgi:hypothetical protein